MTDTPNHVLKIEYDVIELPTVKYMIKYICYSTSHILSMVYIFGCPIIESFSPALCVIK